MWSGFRNSEAGSFRGKSGRVVSLASNTVGDRRTGPSRIRSKTQALALWTKLFSKLVSAMQCLRNASSMENSSPLKSRAFS